MRRAVKLINSLAEIGMLNAAVEEFTNKHEVDPDIVFKINLALEEIFTNIVRYGFPDQKIHEIIVALDINQGKIDIRIEDDGREFNPLLAPQPDVNAPLEQRRPGGLGIYLVRTLMDRVEYHRQSGKNILTLMKHLTQTRSDSDGDL